MKFIVADGLRETRLSYKDEILALYPNANVFQCMSVEDALFVLLDKKPDVIITSEKLAFRNAYELSQLLKKNNIEIPIIVVAKDGNNALDAIKSNVFDFIIQPQESGILQEAIRNAVLHIEKHFHESIIITGAKNVRVRLNTATGYRLIDLDELVYFLADGSYTRICLSSGEMECSSYFLGRIADELLKYHFIRISRSMIVNMKNIHKIDRRNEQCFVDVNGEQKIFKISRMAMKSLEKVEIL